MSFASKFSTQSLARICTRRPWITIAIWGLVLVAALGLQARFLSDALTTEVKLTNDPESIRGENLLAERLRGPRPIHEVIVVQSDTLTVDNAAFQERVHGLFGQVMGLGHDIVVSGGHYYQSNDPSLVSADRGSTLIPFIMNGELDDTTEDVEVILDLVAKANGEDGFFVAIFGDASFAFESDELAVSDIEQGERFGVPMALIILIVLFGAVLAAIIPIALAAVAIIVALGATALVGQVFEFLFFVTLMITMIGLAVGIDYSLIVVSRFREELNKGRSKYEAIEVTGATASRTVFFSGLTVVVALGGMLIIPATVFQSLGAGAILVVISAVLATLTLLPAVLVLMGHRINALRVPFFGRRVGQSDSGAGGGYWNLLTKTVMNHPVVALVFLGGLMLAAAVPLVDLKTGFNGVESMPDRIQAKSAFLVLEEKFSAGVASSTDIVIEGDVGSVEVQQAVKRLLVLLEADFDFMAGAATALKVNDEGEVGLVSVPLAGTPSGDRAIAGLERLRHEHIPLAFAGVDAKVLVTGDTAFSMDFFHIIDTYTPIVFAVVLGLSLLLLTVAFRSIVVPIKSIILNLLSVGAAYGLMVLVFQKGVGAELLGFEQTEIIEAWIPLFLFSVLFGLSMDYHMFLLSRIRERYDITKDNAESVAFGLRSTASLITGAALIMVAVFGGFAAGDGVSNQQVGFGLAVAIFLDATIVRSILVPATMRLLGPTNWYFPKALHWMPRVGIEGDEVSPAALAGSGDD